jgi:LL-diaminopimelate aminotransferase
MDFFKDKIAARLGGAQFGDEQGVYKFERIKRLKRQAAVNFPDLRPIDMGVGEPDMPADRGIADVLRQECGLPENRFYADNGILEFQTAAAEYMQTIYGVKGLDPRKHILHGIGTKPIFAMLPLCLIDPGDISIVTVPGYPVLGTYTRYLGGTVFSLPLRPENNFYPDFDEIPAEIRKRSKLLYINYPNNPTGQAATPEFFKAVVAFARTNNIAVVHDAAYASLTYDDAQPLSFLSADGALEVGVEVQSLSKAFNMTGWRLGFLAGNEKLVKACGTVKDNTDSGQFRAIQKAGIYALHHPELTLIVREKYSRRLNLLVETLREVGFHAAKPKGTFYCYVPIPKGTKSGISFQSAQEVAEHLILNANISVVPWDDCGSYLRLSVTYEAQSPEEEIDTMNALKSRLSALEFVF